MEGRFLYVATPGIRDYLEYGGHGVLAFDLDPGHRFVLAKVVPNSGVHNTIVGPDGCEAYLAGLKSPLLTVAELSSHLAARTIGPFSNFIRPFMAMPGREKLWRR